jgi:hypothetical protein
MILHSQDDAEKSGDNVNGHPHDVSADDQRESEEEEERNDHNRREEHSPRHTPYVASRMSDAYRSARGAGRPNDNPYFPSTFNDRRQYSHYVSDEDEMDSDEMVRYYVNWTDDNNSDDSEDDIQTKTAAGARHDIGETDDAMRTDSARMAAGVNHVITDETMNERLEWQSMLAQVLTGEVIKSEKRRMLSNPKHQAANLNYQIWLGVRAMTRCSTVAEEKLLVESRRRHIDPVLKEVMDFAVQPNDISALDQAAEILRKVDQCESLYPSSRAMMADKRLYKTAQFHEKLDALNSWLTVTRSLQTQLKILQNWTGSETLEIGRAKDAPADAENPSFIERILKENGLKRTFEKRTLITLNSLVRKAKTVMINNADAFAKMKLPPYTNELQKLLNFPTKLMEECMKLLLEYANRLPDLPPEVTIQQTMEDFRITIELGCQIKQQYIELIQPAPGWEIPPCIDENYNAVLLGSLKFYFKLLQWKLKSGFKTVYSKEAEILDHEWTFLNKICRTIGNGERVTAEQFWCASGIRTKLIPLAISNISLHPAY